MQINHVHDIVPFFRFLYNILDKNSFNLGSFG